MPAPKSPSPIGYTKARQALRRYANPARAQVYGWYFKDPGQDRFLGVSTKDMRSVARQFRDLAMPDVRKLMLSRVHEERSLAHAILRWKFEKGNEAEREKIFNFYIRHRDTIHSWDGVDDSAPYIVGAYLLERDKSLLYDLARSPRIWDRRIAMVATLWFIRHGHIQDTLKLAEVLLKDKEDLIHKACGWALREVGKKDLPIPEAISEAALPHHAKDHAALCHRKIRGKRAAKVPEGNRLTQVSRRSSNHPRAWDVLKCCASVISREDLCRAQSSV